MGNEEPRSSWQGSKEVTKQQKRKAKAAICVWVLHDLLEQERPSDSFLFYYDVEKEIKHATAVKLEEFIAIKARPIDHSVREWVKQAKSKVKSIVEWIKKGGKNNREVLDWLDRWKI